VNAPPGKRLPVVSKTVKVSGHDIEVWNDDLFGRLRWKHGIPDDFLNSDGEKSVSFERAHRDSDFGKGGEGQYASSDSRFIVKAVSSVDHASLLQHAEAYVERLLQGETLMVPIYVHFRDTVTKKVYMAMRNLAPETFRWSEKYDLKGCADDKTLLWKGELIPPIRRRFYRADLWCKCNWTPQRWRYVEGKERAAAFEIELPRGQRDKLVQVIEGDADWLTEQGLMDYSLFVAIRVLTAGQEKQDDAGVQRYTIVNSDAVSLEVTFGIIDFLQPWTRTKKTAECIKCLEFNKATVPPPIYGARFKRHFAARFRAATRLEQDDHEVLPSVPAAAAEAATAAAEACSTKECNHGTMVSL